MRGLRECKWVVFSALLLETPHRIPHDFKLQLWKSIFVCHSKKYDPFFAWFVFGFLMGYLGSLIQLLKMLLTFKESKKIAIENENE